MYKLRLNGVQNAHCLKTHCKMNYVHVLFIHIFNWHFLDLTVIPFIFKDHSTCMSK